MRHPLIEEIEKPYLKDKLPKLRVGDSVSVAVKIKEGSKERIQKFDGLLIATSGTGTGETITVRKISSGVGVERVFLVHSPVIDKIVVLSKGKPKVRRAKLYYMRKLKGKKARIVYKAEK
ncbi:MAG: 50S ribosomal protein L19 [Candidatus Caenarcaniphilales bacterium]|nr:50S ribosomal protein L19 [Candidatus Caenarcaniphilales bacterium]